MTNKNKPKRKEEYNFTTSIITHGKRIISCGWPFSYENKKAKKDKGGIYYLELNNEKST